MTIPVGNRTMDDFRCGWPTGDETGTASAGAVHLQHMSTIDPHGNVHDAAGLFAGRLRREADPETAMAAGPGDEIGVGGRAGA